MIKNWIQLAGYALLAVLVACGAGENDTYEDDMAQVQQAFSETETATYQFGTRSSDSALACNKTSTTQVCMVLRGVTGTVNAKRVEWRFAPVHGFSASEMADIRSSINGLDGTLSKWTFAEVTGGTPPIQIGKAVVSGASTSNNIDAFRLIRWDLPTNLSEGAGVVGNYQSATAVISLDAADIIARATVEEAKVAGDQFERFIFLRTVTVNAFLAALGQGTRDDAQSNGTCHDRTVVFPGSLLRPSHSAGADCQLENHGHFNDGTVTEGGICAD